MLGGGDPTCLCLMASCPPAFVGMTSTIISTIIRIIITLADSVAISIAVQRDESESEREYMARSSLRQWGQSSSDNEEPQPSPAKAKRWTADSSDEEFKGTSSVSRKGGWPTCHSGSDGSQQPKKSRHWLVPESAKSSRAQCAARAVCIPGGVAVRSLLPRNTGDPLPKGRALQVLPVFWGSRS